MFESELMGSGYLATGYVIGSVVRECVVIIGQAVSGRWISTLDTAVYSLVTLVVDFYALGTIVMACSQAYQSDLSSAALIKAFLCTTAGPGFLFSILSGLVRCLTAIGFYLRYKEVPHSEESSDYAKRMEEIVQSLHTDTFENLGACLDQDYEKQQMSCCICLMDFKSMSIATQLDCHASHIFHDKCIQ